MIAAIDDRRHSTEKHHFKNLLSPEELKEQLKSVRHKKVLVVLLVDLLDLPGSLLNSIRPLIGMNPILLIGTKADLLPKHTQLPEVLVWLRDCAVSKRLNVVDVHLVSNRNKTGEMPADVLFLSLLRVRNNASHIIYSKDEEWKGCVCDGPGKCWQISLRSGSSDRDAYTDLFELHRRCVCKR